MRRCKLLPLIVLLAGCEAGSTAAWVLGLSVAQAITREADVTGGPRLSSCGVLRSGQETSLLPVGLGLELLSSNSDDTFCLVFPSFDWATVAGSDTRDWLCALGAAFRWTAFRSSRFDHRLSLGGAYTELHLDQPGVAMESSSQVLIEYRVRSRHLRIVTKHIFHWEFGVSAYLPVDGDIIMVIPSMTLFFRN